MKYSKTCLVILALTILAFGRGVVAADRPPVASALPTPTHVERPSLEAQKQTMLFLLNKIATRLTTLRDKIATDTRLTQSLRDQVTTQLNQSLEFLAGKKTEIGVATSREQLLSIGRQVQERYQSFLKQQYPKLLAQIEHQLYVYNIMKKIDARYASIGGPKEDIEILRTMLANGAVSRKEINQQIEKVYAGFGEVVDKQP